MIRLKELRTARKLYQKDIAQYLQIAVSTYSYWENGAFEPDTQSLQKLAEYFGVSVDYLLGRDESPKFSPSFSENEMYSFPVIGTITAGYNGIAEESQTGEKIKVPPHLIKTHNPDDYFVLEISGDSMFPLLEHGDKVLIRKSASVDNGAVAAVGFDGEQATVKKVEYIPGEDWMRLIPRNPKYPVVTIHGSELELCRIYGEVVYLFRERIRF